MININTMISAQKKNYLQILMAFIVIELILGGSGHLISVFGVSLRLILFFLIFLCEIIFALKGYFKLNSANVVLFIYITYIFSNYLWSITSNNFADATNEFTGYLPIVFIPFFISYFSFYDDKNKLKKIIEISTLILAFLSLFIWLYCFIGGMLAIKNILDNFLNPFNYGNLAMISGKIPRLFLKGCIFSVIGFIFKLNDIVDGSNKISDIFCLLIYILSILITFTVGIYFATAVATILYFLFSSSKNIKRKSIILIVFFLVLLVGIYRFNLLGIMESRFSGDYTFDFKGTQFRELLKVWMESPIFGKGFGYNLTIDYGFQIVTTYSFEIMWMQLLAHTGIVGTILYVIHIALTLATLFNKYKFYDNQIYLLYGLSIVIICIESFTNPFMNNAIGIMFYCICCGIAYGDADAKLKSIDDNAIKRC